MKFQSLAGAWAFKQTGMQEWLPATVPGGVHTDLFALGRIPDPFIGDNEKRVQWVAENDWEYQSIFMVDDELFKLPHIWLVCDGLDTLASVSLNGTLLGQTENMFRQYRWDVKNFLIPGNNTLHITFMGPARYAAQKQAIRPLAGVPQAIPGSPYLRKAPCQFGWDWGPKLPPIGIWKDIRLEGYECARIEDIYLRQIHENGQVTVHAALSITNWGDEPLTANMQIIEPDKHVLQSTLPVEQNGSCHLELTVPNPQLWWPNGYGKQPLYQVIIELYQTGRLVAQQKAQLGLRTIKLRQEPDEWGRSFAFVVNDQNIYIKGSDWIPADSFPTRISDESLKKIIHAAAETHQNMLRVWGGGFYEEERFYDLCDRYGILVWQDFVFSCSIYPLDDAEFVENVHTEIKENIHRLRHRASLALWCGNNEMEQGWVDWNWKGADFTALKGSYDQFFHHTLPGWCAEEDPDHTYWPSSPSSDTPFENPNGQQQGDAHYWDVWHGRKPFTDYRKQFPRFMSEFGFQALPPMDTIRTYADEADWNMTSYIMEQHQKNDSGNALMVAQMLDSFRLPYNFESLVYLSMVLQAEGIRYGVEHWRRHPQRVAGILYWQLNDCWPVASWSSIDYYGRWKALHYAAKRFFAPLLLSIEDHENIQDIYLTNELMEPYQGSVRWSLETLDGIVLDMDEETAQVMPQNAALISHHDLTDQLNHEQQRDTVFIAELWQDGRMISRQTSFFVPTKHLKLVNPQIKTNLSMQNGQLIIELSAQALARLVECSLEGVDAIFSDNYFDLPAGHNVTITVPLPEPWNLSMAKAALRIQSIYDSFA